MREQKGFDTSAQSQTHSAGYHSGIHPEDVPRHTDDSQARRTKGTMLSDEWVGPKSHGSTRSYQRSIQTATPHRIIRVTTHEPQPFPRRFAVQTVSEPNTQVRQQKKVPKWIVYGGLCLCMMLLGGILVNAGINWMHVTWDDWRYGRPRTYQCDADVGHGGVSHFTVENLGGTILILEVVPTNPKKSYTYVGPELTGGDGDLAVATISFQNTNNVGHPDMVITVSGVATYVFVNTPDGFKPQSGQGGNS